MGVDLAYINITNTIDYSLHVRTQMDSETVRVYYGQPSQGNRGNKVKKIH